MKNLIVFAFLLLTGCRNNENSLQPLHPEALSVEDAMILDDKPEVQNLKLDSIVLPNGMSLTTFMKEVDPDFLSSQTLSNTRYSNEQNLRIRATPYDRLGPQDSKNLLISHLTVAAASLADRKNFQFSKGGENQPRQDGIVYLWGGKNHNKRKAPEKNSTCNYEVHGLDCSGFVHQVFKLSGVKIVEGNANTQKDPKTLGDAIRSSIPQLKKISVEDMGSMATNNFENGDIIYWLNEEGIASHIGIVLKKTNDKLAVFQSNGKEGTDEANCVKNLSNKRGVRILDLGNAYWFGSSKSYGVTRINADISGKWRIYMRCENSTIDVITLDLDFNSSASNDFVITGKGEDYDGSPLECKGNMKYDKAANELSGSFLITSPSAPDFFRNDSFSIKLSRDATGYFPLKLGNSNNAGCKGEARLTNLEVNDKSTTTRIGLKDSRSKTLSMGFKSN